MNDEQVALLEKLGLPLSFERLADKDLMHIEDALADELQIHGISDAGNGLNAYGKLCRSIIVMLPD